MLSLLHNYLAIALRHLRRTPGITTINVVGLALGMATCLLIVLYVQDELSYDRFHEKADRIVRVTQAASAQTPPALAPAMEASLPGVEQYTRVLPTLGDVLVRRSDDPDVRFYEDRFYFADSTIFDVFTFPLVRGDPRAALQEVNTLVITESVARKYFGDTDPMGRALTLDVGFQIDLRVAGVMHDPPSNAHFRPDFLASIASFEALGFIDFASWNASHFQSYLVLAPSQSMEAVAAALPAFAAQHTAETRTSYHLQPLPRVHLHSHLRFEMEPPGNPAAIYVIAAITLLILLIACVNFVNLATARFTHRAREVGVRKALGAGRRTLVAQFLGESLLLALLALLVAVPLVVLALPAFNQLAGKEMALDVDRLPFFLLALGGLTVLVGLVAGSYPALFLSAFEPVRALRGRLGHGASGARVRQGLVVFQFVIGVALVAGTLAVQQQLTFMQDRPLGFDREQTVVVAARLYGHATKPVPFDALRDQFVAHPNVRAVAVTDDVPGQQLRQAPFLPEGMIDPDEMAETTWNVFGVDYDVVETLGLEIVAGRSFSRDVPTDEREAFILNETALNVLRDRYGSVWDDPIGRRLDRYVEVDTEWYPARVGRVIGIVRDFHYQSLHQPIAPLVLEVNQPLRDHFLVRIRPEGVSETLAYLKRTWTDAMPNRPFEYYFLDAAFERLYRADRRVAVLVGCFTVLSLVIACLGLFGLAAFVAEQRTKEIGVRKVLGASAAQIVLLLTREITLLVLLAIGIAVPLAFWGVRRWLASFAYHIDLSWTIFLLAGVLALAVALLTVSYQTFRAAATDPVRALRYE